MITNYHENNNIINFGIKINGRQLCVKYVSFNSYYSQWRRLLHFIECEHLPIIAECDHVFKKDIKLWHYMLLHGDKRHIEEMNFLKIQKVFLTRSSVQIAIWWIAVDRFLWSIHPYSSSFLQCIDQLHSNSCIFLINKPTRVKNQSATLIDNIFTNSLSDMDHTIQGIIYSDISDHFPTIHINYSFQAANLDSEIMVRNLSQRNKQAFCRAVSEVDWGPCIFLEMHKNLSLGFTQRYQGSITNTSRNKSWIKNIILGKCG